MKIANQNNRRVVIVFLFGLIILGFWVLIANLNKVQEANYHSPFVNDQHIHQFILDISKGILE